MNYNKVDYKDTPSPLSPEREKEIPYYLSRIDKQLSQCFDGVNFLKARLNPIIGSYLEDCGDPVVKSGCSTELGGALRDILDRLTSFDDIINRISGGLEL